MFLMMCRNEILADFVLNKLSTLWSLQSSCEIKVVGVQCTLRDVQQQLQLIKISYPGMPVWVQTNYAPSQLLYHPDRAIGQECCLCCWVHTNNRHYFIIWGTLAIVQPKISRDILCKVSEDNAMPEFTTHWLKLEKVLQFTPSFLV